MNGRYGRYKSPDEASLWVVLLLAAAIVLGLALTALVLADVLHWIATGTNLILPLPLPLPHISAPVAHK